MVAIRIFFATMTKETPNSIFRLKVAASRPDSRVTLVETWKMLGKKAETIARSTIPNKGKLPTELREGLMKFQ